MDDVTPQYLSREWEDQQHQWLEEQYGDGVGCGGISGPEPCGGCTDCLHAQMSYYISKEREQARVFQAAGFEVAPPQMIVLEWQAGFEGGHDSYNCKMAGELYDYHFPWEKKGKETA